MTLFYLDERRFHAEPGETVLDTLIRYQQPINYSCKKGSCRACLLQCLEGDLSLISQRGLEPSHKQAGLLFACQCIPSSGLKLATAKTQTLYQRAQLIKKQILTDTVALLRFQGQAGEAMQAGQCINLCRDDGVSRTYAITAVQTGTSQVDSSPTFEVHVECKRNGDLSTWLYHQAEAGQWLQIQGPWGYCHYIAGKPKETLILFGSGTGGGAALGIANEALAQGHEGEIYLYHSGKQVDDLYQHGKLLRTMLRHRNFYYQGCVSAGSDKTHIDGKRIRLADPLELASARHHYTSNHRVYLCGDARMVLKGQERVFLGGVPIERIHLLSFDYRELRKTPRSWL